MAKAKLIRCPAPLLETVPNPMLTRMLEAAPLVEEKGGGDQGATASTKEAIRKGRIENSPDQGKKRTASEDPEVITSKQGKKSLPESLASENAPDESPPKGDPLSPET